MPTMVMMDELHLVVLVPRQLSARECRSIRRVLNSRRFRTALGQALRQLFRRYPSLAKTTIRVAA